MFALIMTLATFLTGSVAAGAPRILFHAAPDGRSLKGLEAVYVEVRYNAPPEHPYGLSEAGLRSEVELTLKANGIRTLRTPEWRGAAGKPYLSVNVVGNTLDARLNDTTFFYTLTFDLVQQVHLDRHPGLLCDGVTWSEGTTLRPPPRQAEDRRRAGRDAGIGFFTGGAGGKCREGTEEKMRGPGSSTVQKASLMSK